MKGKGDSQNGRNGFESEARERLATIEAQHDNLVEKVDDLSDGQGEILDHLGTLGDNYVEEDEEFDTLREGVDENTKARQQAQVILRYTVVALTLVGGFSGAMVVIL